MAIHIYLIALSPRSTNLAAGTETEGLPEILATKMGDAAGDGLQQHMGEEKTGQAASGRV